MRRSTNKTWARYVLLTLGAMGGLCPAWAQIQEIEIRGICKGEDLFVQNPLHGTDAASPFCIEGVTLNEQRVYEHPRVSALRIALEHLPLQASFTLRITHKEGCTPYVINPEAALLSQDFAFLRVYIEDDNLFWTTSDEESEGVYIIERLNGDEWEHLGDVLAEGMPKGEYMFTPAYSVGVNQLRIRYQTSQKEYFSVPIEWLVEKTPITFSPRVVTRKMTLSRSTYFQILNSLGELILEGETKVIPLRLLPPGDYIIILDGEEYPFVKR